MNIEKMKINDIGGDFLFEDNNLSKTSNDLNHLFLSSGRDAIMLIILKHPYI
jgi:hypothetical protein